jgi:hypothetical protein
MPLRSYTFMDSSYPPERMAPGPTTTPASPGAAAAVAAEGATTGEDEEATSMHLTLPS